MRGKGTFEDGARSLKADLDAVREEYKVAKMHFKEAQKLAYNLGLNAADGAHAIHSATRVYLDRVSRYREAVTRYRQFLIREYISKDPN